jgi:hypothetical protein
MNTSELDSTHNKLVYLLSKYQNLKDETNQEIIDAYVLEFGKANAETIVRTLRKLRELGFYHSKDESVNEGRTQKERAFNEYFGSDGYSRI